MKNLIDLVKFNDKGLVPVITQDAFTGEVLMMAYMNRESLLKTFETKKAHYYSRSRKKIWMKGETSGHFQIVESIKIDCDRDALLLLVQQEGGACHTGHRSCFYSEMKNTIKEVAEKVFDPKEVYKDEKNKGEKEQKKSFSPKILREVYEIIVDRTINPKEGSYTNYLFTKGIDKICKKVGEETSEVIIAAKNNKKDEIVYEISDLIYHLMVLMVDQGINLDDIYEELARRR